jgi:hypothetical protein
MKIIFNINKIEGDQAILADADGLTLPWPKDKLPAGAKAGAEIFFNIGTDPEPAENKDLAKNILNEILSAE